MIKIYLAKPAFYESAGNKIHAWIPGNKRTLCSRPCYLYTFVDTELEENVVITCTMCLQRLSKRDYEVIPWHLKY